MNIVRTVLAQFEDLYAQAVIRRHGESVTYLAASEGMNGPCVAVDAKTRRVSTVWEGPGGSMTLCPLDATGAFLATQAFYPVFDAAESVVVRCTPVAGGYRVAPYLALPYLHRFDLLQSNGKRHFVGASLADGKTSRDDWSRPGKVYGGTLAEDGELATPLRVVVDALTKNHGMWKVSDPAGEWLLVAGTEGVYAVRPPATDRDGWSTERLLDREISDIALVDFDNDGEDELAVIEGFHGNRVSVNKRVGGVWRELYTRDIEFGHALWGGRLLGANRLLVGERGGKRELVCVTPGPTGVDEQVIGRGGPSQISVWEEDGAGMVLAADREAGDLALYRLDGK